MHIQPETAGQDLRHRHILRIQTVQIDKFVPDPVSSLAQPNAILPGKSGLLPACPVEFAFIDDSVGRRFLQLFRQSLIQPHTPTDQGAFLFHDDGI